MARVARAMKEAYSEIHKEELQHPIIFVVDMINGFIKEGALHDEAILTCANPIQTLITDLSCECIFIADAHMENTREFNSYPLHCVKGTSESEVIEELQPYAKTIYYKNSTNAFMSEDFTAFLQEDIYYYDDIIITGCCTDICILQFALSLNAWLNEHNEEHKRIIVPMDCVDTYHIEQLHDASATNTFALMNMEANGILVVSHIESAGAYYD